MDTELEQARADRDRGMAQATDHAERKGPGFTEEALAYLKRYATTHEGHFLAEHVVATALRDGIDPPDARAWGSVFMMASRRQIIYKAGYAPAVSSNLSPKTLWVAAP